MGVRSLVVISFSVEAGGSRGGVGRAPQPIAVGPARWRALRCKWSFRRNATRGSSGHLRRALTGVPTEGWLPLHPRGRRSATARSTGHRRAPSARSPCRGGRGTGRRAIARRAPSRQTAGWARRRPAPRKNPRPPPNQPAPRDREREPGCRATDSEQPSRLADGGKLLQNEAWDAVTKTARECSRWGGGAQNPMGLLRRGASGLIGAVGLLHGDSISLRRPLPQVHGPAALTTERPKPVLRRKARRLAASRAAHDPGRHRPRHNPQNARSKATSRSNTRLFWTPSGIRNRILRAYLLALTSGTQA